MNLRSQRTTKLAIALGGWALLATWGCAGLGARPERLDGALGLPEETDLAGGEGDLFAEFVETNDMPYILLGTLLLPEGGVADGGLLVQDGVILEVWQGEPPATVPTDVETIATGGIILPGLVDLHNHVAYDFLPRWESGRTWDHRYQWAAATAYDRAVKDPYNRIKAEAFDEANKWGEIRGLLGGTTSILGVAARNEAGILARNIDQKTLGRKLLRTWVGEASRFGCMSGCAAQPGEIAALLGDFDSGATAAILFHVAEGKRSDERSRAEFQWFADNDLLRPEVVFTHGTALGPAELEAIGQAGMGLVWSPRSNLELYGETTDVREAARAGVRIALAPDWTPSGSDNALAELRFAAAYNQRELDCLFTARELVAMVTETPAALAGRADRLGKLEVGFVADLVVLAAEDQDPYETVLTADERDVRLVTVNGVPLYGWRSWLSRLGKDGDFSALRVRGLERGLDTDVPDDPRWEKETQSLPDIRQALAAAYAAFGELPELASGDPGPRPELPYCAAP